MTLNLYGGGGVVVEVRWWCKVIFMSNTTFEFS